MNLLTQEQQTIFNESRDTIATHVEWSKQQELNPIPAIYQAAESLVRIIDDLQARVPKQYTEQELREWFENRPLVQDEIDALLHEVVPGENAAWYSVLKFAAHVGALKAEP